MDKKIHIEAPWMLGSALCKRDGVEFTVYHPAGIYLDPSRVCKTCQRMCDSLRKDGWIIRV